MGVYDEHGNINKSDPLEYTAMKNARKKIIRDAGGVKESKFVYKKKMDAQEKMIIDTMDKKNISDGNYGMNF